MRILVSGVCGFAGAALARALAESGSGHELHGFDNFSRPGSETNRSELKRLGVRLVHADQRAPSDLEEFPPCDWVIDAAANPSVLAGVDGRASSRQLVEHNLFGTVNLLEYAKRHRAGFVLLSTSRVYSIAALAGLALAESAGAYRLAKPAASVTEKGIDETFSTAAPISLYGATKLASEGMALEYGETFGIPVFVNRCGILAGAGQFGRADQGIFAFWIHSWRRKRTLKYVGFGGKGLQVRDCLHPRDLLALLDKQMQAPKIAATDRIVNCSGGAASARSLRQLSDWCSRRFGPHAVGTDASERPFDLPWLVLDASKAERIWGWKAGAAVEEVWEEIARHAEEHPEWLDVSAAF